MGSGKMATKSNSKCKSWWLRSDSEKISFNNTLWPFLKDYNNNLRKNKRKLLRNMIQTPNRLSFLRVLDKIYVENWSPLQKIN